MTITGFPDCVARGRDLVVKFLSMDHSVQPTAPAFMPMRPPAPVADPWGKGFAKAWSGRLRGFREVFSLNVGLSVMVEAVDM